MSVIFSVLAFGLVYGAALVGLALQRRQPESHRGSPTKESVQLVMGLIATMAALVLSLLIASSHTYLDTQQEEMQKLASDVLSLDALLARYGPEASDQRRALRANVIAATRTMSSEEGVGSTIATTKAAAGRETLLFEDVLGLQPKTAAQRFYQSKALEMMSQIAATRLLMHEQATSSIPIGLVVVMLLWLMLLFLGFGLYAPKNGTVLVALGFGAFAVAGALFLILEMSHPYQGLMRVSDAPIRKGLEVLGR